MRRRSGPSTCWRCRKRYGPPQDQTAARWRAEAPDGFEFTVKAWQLITHEPSSPTYRRLRTPLRERQRKQAGGFRWNRLTRRAWERTRRIAELLGAVSYRAPGSLWDPGRHHDRIERRHA